MNRYEVIGRILLLAHGSYVAFMALVIGTAYIGDRQFRHVAAMGVSYFVVSCLVTWMIIDARTPRPIELCLAIAAAVIGNYGMFEIYHKSRDYLREQHRGGKS